MHRCLTVDEILGQVFAELGQADLLRTALTCKLFSPIALAILWRHLSDLSPIIRCLLRDAWSAREVQTLGSKFCVYRGVRDLTPQDWDPLLPYLPKIRSIITVSPHAISLTQELLETIASSFHGQTIFPNLHSLTMTGVSGGATEFMKRLLGPRLESLSFGLTSLESNRSKTSFLRSIPLASPNLKRLDIDHKTDNFPEISEAICQCKHLEEISAPCLSELALIHVSKLPGLRYLAIHHHNSSGITVFPSVPAPAFPALKQLHLMDSSPQFDASMHSIISSPYYQEYRAKFDELVKAKEWLYLFTQIATMEEPPLSIDVNVKQPEESLDTQGIDYLITSNKLLPLLSLHQLTDLCMSSAYTFDLDNAFVLELAKACPKLRVIDLGSKWISQRVASTTLIAYAYLLQNCFDLERIGLVINAMLPPINFTFPANRTGGPRTLANDDKNLSLCGGNSYIEDPGPVTAFISSTLPEFDGTSLTGPIGGLKSLATGNKSLSFCVGNSYIEDPGPVAAFLSVFIGSNLQRDVSIVTDPGCRFDLKDLWSDVEKMIPFIVKTRAAGIPFIVRHRHHSH